MKILVLNSGSSSIKCQYFIEQKSIASVLVERIGEEESYLQILYSGTKESYSSSISDHHQALNTILSLLMKRNVLASIDELDAVGHRVVHGGEVFQKPTLINREVIETIRSLIPLAPLHNPANLIGIEACMKALPGVPNVAVFDTAFHQTMPPKAFHYALPYKFYEEDHIRRYGFHGTSHKYVTKTFAKLINKSLDEVNVVTVHLGNGSSLACVKNGKCVDTSMGLTPLAGVIMGTRCGDIDPALVVYIMKKKGLSPSEVDTLMNKKSGLLGFSDVSSDMRDIEAAARKNDKQSIIILEMWAYSIAKYINAYVGTLPKTDAVIFTAGIGENAPGLRKIICENCTGLGIKLGENNNNIRGEIGRASADDSKIPVYVIPTNEELQIAQGTSALLKNKT